MNNQDEDYVVTASFDTEIAGRKAHVECRSPAGLWTQEHTQKLLDYMEYGPQITLNSGRVIKMTSLRQHVAYSSMIEGVPFGPNYEWLIDQEVRWARHDAPDSSIQVIEPELVKLPFLDEELDVIRKFYRREPVCIGPVACRGYFRSDESSKELHASYMTIIWFQKEFMSSMDEWTLTRIKTIDWEALSLKETVDEFLANL